MSNIMLYAEVTGDNYLHTVVFELANKAHELAKKLDNGTVSALLVCKSGLAENFKEAFSNSGFDYVYVAENNRFTHYSTELYSKIAIDIIKDVKPEVILIGATTQGRDLAPRIAATLHTGLTADCIDLDINEKGKLAATRPTFGGKLMATILCKTLPQMATVRPKVFKPMSEDCVRPTQYVYVKPEIDSIQKNVEFIEFEKILKSTLNELDSAKIIVAGGKGLKNEIGFELLKNFAESIGGVVGASRGAVEIGLAPVEIQIGQTGKTVTPKLYIACGISGAIQHIVGMQDSDKIIAINIDKNAPIFEHADYGIVGDAFEILPKLTDRFRIIN
mgnify:FL=1